MPKMKYVKLENMPKMEYVKVDVFFPNFLSLSSGSLKLN